MNHVAKIFMVAMISIIILLFTILLFGCYNGKKQEYMGSSFQGSSVAVSAVGSSTTINTVETADSIVIKEFVHDTISTIKTIYRPGKVVEHRDTVSVIQKETVHLKDTVFFTRKDEASVNHSTLGDKLYLIIVLTMIGAVVWIVHKASK